MEPFDLSSLPSLHLKDRFIIDEVTIDSRQISSENSLFVALKGKQFDGHAFLQDAASRGAKGALVKKGSLPKTLPPSFCLIEVDDPLLALQNLATAYRKELAVPILAIGGAVGKTLVKDFLAELLKKSFSFTASPESFNSQIGVPLSLLKIKRENQFALIEAAISEPGEMEKLAEMLEPTYTLLTPLEPIPITPFSKKEWFEEWQKLLLATKGGWSLVPSASKGDFPLPSYAWDQPEKGLPHASFSQKTPNKEMPYFINYPSGKIVQGQFRGNYTYILNLVNMAIKAASLLGLSEELIEERTRSISLELMRTEIFRSSTGTTFMNAPYSSDPQSVSLSLKNLSLAPRGHQKDFVFGGLKGEGRTSSLKTIGESIAASPVDRLFLYGDRNFAPLLATLQERGFKKTIEQFPTLEEATLKLKEGLHHDQTILLKGPEKIGLERLIELVNDSPSHNLCFIHLSALKHNLSLFRAKAPKKKIMVMVKAQGYGTDDWQLARFLEREGIDFLGLSYVEEAISLRRAGVKQQLFVLNAMPYEIEKVAKFDLQIGIGDIENLPLLQQAAVKYEKTIKLHLHVDTGMSRFGCAPSKALEIAEAIKTYPNLVLEGLMTHLSGAEDPKHDTFTSSQIEAFQKIKQSLAKKGHAPPLIHVSNSAALLRFPDIEENMSRIGLSIFGHHPSQETLQFPLKQAVSLHSKIVGINQCSRGSTVSYGRSYTVDREEAKIAVLPIGYFDGLHRHYSGKGYVVIRGHKAPMVGKICMDYMMVDVSDVENVAVGDPVLLFGSDDHGHVASPEAFSAQSQGDIHELVTCLGPRIPRIFIDE